MSGGQGITQELSLGDVISKTFELYRRDFSKYLILFVVVEAIIGVLTTLVQRAIVLPAVPPDITTPQQFLNWMPGFFGALITLIALSATVTWVLYPISVGSAVKLASEEIVTGRADLAASVRFAVSRIIWLWVVGIVVGIIVFLGFVALVVPGIILAIMFSLVLPVLIIESSGFESLSRSRQLVSHRWLKTLAMFIVFAVMVGIASAIVSAISEPFGVASTIVSSILSAFYLPIIPIALTVYYYSNAARIAPPQMGQAPTAPGATLQAGMKFCPNCGTQIPSTTMFCTTCGAKQPA
jgi:hypothetical protein